jgi:NAD(P)-dependent dehydrogenase (short-subunit alcohol dehydrogenase family)
MEAKRMGSEQVVLITGGAGYLGATTAAAFRRDGARTVLVDRSLDKLQRAHPDHHRTADLLLIGGVDLTDEATLRDVAARALASFGAIDALVNTVGVYRAGQPVAEEPLETWDLLLSLNVRTALVACRAVLPSMLARGRGRIVNVASRDALAGAAGVAAYAASKAALLRLTESIAAETAGRGVTANCVLPGPLDSPQNRSRLPADAHASLVAPAAVADVILFLASDAARAVSGAAIPTCGPAGATPRVATGIEAAGVTGR